MIFPIKIPTISAIIRKAYGGRADACVGTSTRCDGGGVDDTVSDIATFLKRNSSAWKYKIKTGTEVTK